MLFRQFRIKRLIVETTGIPCNASLLWQGFQFLSFQCHVLILDFRTHQYQKTITGGQPQAVYQKVVQRINCPKTPESSWMSKLVHLSLPLISPVNKNFSHALRYHFPFVIPTSFTQRVIFQQILVTLVVTHAQFVIFQALLKKF